MKHDFQGRLSDELSVNAGDSVRVLKMVRENRIGLGVLRRDNEKIEVWIEDIILKMSRFLKRHSQNLICKNDCFN